ncbi:MULTISPECIES: ABC transporter ATP-binding protein [unclassified Neisseria]|uniref:ABC transporter ATP-binding protein n=1 Tax=unclassified Neisseria TaxID=2623750 RepID=UPI002666D625|nr:MULTISPECIES: ABC transporter ATP-binding protein [unclassified Neisseria]MDO1508876.1 ABC transporter ATP-binding protein [Neisseria sp. MVDL19-042950]MDO1515135.1 ABC transporter ATP-binding protein [Neisseria sp. MVDL18-041461]MDO1562495.1 ABC transporter ATP-binding protein [Neisseria sp. MVDL20-010259]
MIEIKNLSHQYPNAQVPALRGVSLEIGEGETLGLLGPNGAGKTTLMSLLAGLQPGQSGQITFDGVPFARLSKKQRHQISLVPQDFAFYPLLSVWDNLKFFAALYDVKDKAHLQQLLEETGLEAHRNKLAKHLSGGLKRRLNFAVGLINRPRLIFLDEITVGIDPESRRFILESVAELGRRGVTVIYTSHYLQEIELLCKNLVLLNHGRMIYQGGVQDILQQNGRSGLSVQTQPPLSDEHVAVLNGKREANGAVRIETQTAEPVWVFLQEKGYAVTACQFGFASLESFYLDFLRNQAEVTC